MVNIRLVVTAFASHQTWAEGYQRFASTRGGGGGGSRSDDVRLTIVPGDRWKFRMMAAAAELESEIALDDEIVVVDAMIDVTVLVALLKSNRPPHQCPRIFLYFHENQLSTPFTEQDRDYHKRNEQHQTHWHYGMAHWRSMLVADGCIFNSQTHYEAFAKALPKVLNEQCPRDAVGWQLSKCHELLSTKCTVLKYGLDLDELAQERVQRQQPHSPQESTPAADNPWTSSAGSVERRTTPVILWNARLEEDKNPGEFLEFLRQIPPTIPFQLLVLGADPSKGQKWLTQIQEEFGKKILFMGWIEDRIEYGRWLHQASIVLSTAKHETFGISIVESVFCGALPLLPNRLSYPEILSLDGNQEELLLYSTIQDGVTKLLHLLNMYVNKYELFQTIQAAAKSAVSKFRWESMGPIYRHFFFSLAKGDAITDAGSQAAAMALPLVLGLSGDQIGTTGAKTTTSTLPEISTGGETGGLVTSCPLSYVEIYDEEDGRVQLFRPKSLRNRNQNNHQGSERPRGMEPALHGGRRATVRMLEAIQLGAKIHPIAFLTTRDLAKSILLPSIQCITKESSEEKSSSHEGRDALRSAPIYVADKDLLDCIRGQKLNSGDAILALIQFPMVSRLDDLLTHAPILILENVRNSENVGSILRTAFCLGITSIVASETAWAALKDSRAARCSMGTMYYHRYYRASSTARDDSSESLMQTIREIQRADIRVYGIEIGDSAKPIVPHAGSGKKWAAVMGNEDTGLSRLVATACDEIVFIPQAHGDSLNVGHAAAIAMFELGRGGATKENDCLAACP